MRIRPHRETAGHPEVCIRAFLFQGHQLLYTKAPLQTMILKQIWVIRLWTLLQDDALRTACSVIILAQDACNLGAPIIFGVSSVHREGLLHTAHAVKSPARNTSSPPQDAFQWNVAEGDTRR